ncbi:Uncharacterised protein [Mycobacteroides abscessus subsp. abscessus]|nr:Uncharacterised protein [Mycobacteroides abscessus subsp. abscessus]
MTEVLDKRAQTLHVLIDGVAAFWHIGFAVPQMVQADHFIPLSKHLGLPRPDLLGRASIVQEQNWRAGASAAVGECVIPECEPC